MLCPPMSLGCLLLKNDEAGGKDRTTLQLVAKLRGGYKNVPNQYKWPYQLLKTTASGVKLSIAHISEI
ncbi:10367_t:CDS:2 [Paraglomus brasilianum]|uniref:10367_t:CDS:1 n=1 Tax=Paraglomus brasilianum TaxID=144538 RepID=A0A9N9B330_9GLOM|nr:10367_t:CDS:2 [Paraglomus brasilianum]